jgi:hypothetical protein
MPFSAAHRPSVPANSKAKNARVLEQICKAQWMDQNLSVGTNSAVCRKQVVVTVREMSLASCCRTRCSAPPWSHDNTGFMI